MTKSDLIELLNQIDARSEYSKLVIVVKCEGDHYYRYDFIFENRHIAYFLSTNCIPVDALKELGDIDPRVASRIYLKSNFVDLVEALIYDNSKSDNTALIEKIGEYAKKIVELLNGLGENTGSPMTGNATDDTSVESEEDIVDPATDVESETKEEEVEIPEDDEGIEEEPDVEDDEEEGEDE